MKAVFLITFLVSVFVVIPKVSQIRADYSKSNGNREMIVKLHDALTSVERKDNKVLVAYKGAVLTAMAKYAKAKKDKKEFFKKGAELLEFAVYSQPNDIEIRTIRLSIQENAPKFLKYNKSIPEDKEFILKNYKKISSSSIREFVSSYVLQSKGFSSLEKEQF
jgi:hypothetical protein